MTKGLGGGERGSQGEGVPSGVVERRVTQAVYSKRTHSIVRHTHTHRDRQTDTQRHTETHRRTPYHGRSAAPERCATKAPKEERQHAWPPHDL